MVYSSREALKIIHVDGSDSQFVAGNVSFIEWIDATHIAFGDQFGDYIAEVGGEYTQLPSPSCASYVRTVPR